MLGELIEMDNFIHIPLNEYLKENFLFVRFSVHLLYLLEFMPSTNVQYSPQNEWMPLMNHCSSQTFHQTFRDGKCTGLLSRDTHKMYNKSGKVIAQLIQKHNWKTFTTNLQDKKNNIIPTSLVRDSFKLSWPYNII